MVNLPYVQRSPKGFQKNNNNREKQCTPHSEVEVFLYCWLFDMQFGSDCVPRSENWHCFTVYRCFTPCRSTLSSKQKHTMILSSLWFFLRIRTYYFWGVEQNESGKMCTVQCFSLVCVNVWPQYCNFYDYVCVCVLFISSILRRLESCRAHAIQMWILCTIVQAQEVTGSAYEAAHGRSPL